MKKILLLLLLLLPFISFTQDIKRLIPKNIDADVQYSKKYQAYIVSPFSNTNIKDCSTIDDSLDRQLNKVSPNEWTNENWYIIKLNVQFGQAYIFKQKN